MSQLIPSTFRATITDRFIAAFFEGKSDTMIQMELRFGESLDAATLGRAFDQALDAEPILGCRFAHDSSGVRWVRLKPSERHNFRVFTNKPEYESYRSATIDPVKGPALEGALLQTEQGDTLLFKVAHEASDAAGAKDAVAIVSYIYRQLLRSPEFTPAPNTKSYRSARQLFKWFPKRAVPLIWLNALCEMVPLVLKRRACNPFIASTGTAHRGYRTWSIAANKVLSIKKYGEIRHATINDILLAAFLRALYKNRLQSGGVLRCGMTIDLRKWYLPGGTSGTIANLSNIEVFDIGKKPGKEFEATLSKVVRFTRKRKNNWIGLNLHCGLINLFRTWSFSRMKRVFSAQQKKDMSAMAIFPVLTNMGTIEQKSVTFGSLPETAHTIVPAGIPPYFGIGISGYEGTLTISAAVYSETETVVSRLVGDMLCELDLLTT